MTTTYKEPVAKLLQLGRPEEPWQDYAALGITSGDVPELIRLVQDHDLRMAKPPPSLPENSELPEWFAQIHAWRALAQLKAEEAIPAILGVLHQVDDDDDDWIGEDAQQVFASIGPAAIGPVRDYLKDSAHGVYARVSAAASLRAIGRAYPERREECAGLLASALEDYMENDEGLNGFLVYDLVQLQAVQHIDLIEKAFQSERVDEMIMGDFEDVQVELGLIEERTTEPARFPFVGVPSSPEDAFQAEERSKRSEKKEKQKRKQEKKSRKKNRKRK